MFEEDALHGGGVALVCNDLEACGDGVAFDEFVAVGLVDDVEVFGKEAGAVFW